MRSMLLRGFVVLCVFAIVMSATDFTRDQLKLLQDPGGWEYLKMAANSGIQTDHPCFDGKLHPQTCRGHLTLSSDNRFVQEVIIQGQGVPRHGRYTLEGDQLTFFDELETKDGPYTLELDPVKEMLVMSMQQVRVEMISERMLRTRKRKETK